MLLRKPQAFLHYCGLRAKKLFVRFSPEKTDEAYGLRSKANEMDFGF